jgi:hypothetical protein
MPSRAQKSTHVDAVAICNGVIWGHHVARQAARNVVEVGSSKSPVPVRTFEILKRRRLFGKIVMSLTDANFCDSGLSLAKKVFDVKILHFFQGLFYELLFFLTPSIVVQLDGSALQDLLLNQIWRRDLVDTLRRTRWQLKRGLRSLEDGTVVHILRRRGWKEGSCIIRQSDWGRQRRRHSQVELLSCLESCLLHKRIYRSYQKGYSAECRQITT